MLVLLTVFPWLYAGSVSKATVNVPNTVSSVRPVSPRRADTCCTATGQHRASCLGGCGSTVSHVIDKSASQIGSIHCEPGMNLALCPYMRTGRQGGHRPLPGCPAWTVDKLELRQSVILPECTKPLLVSGSSDIFKAGESQLLLPAVGEYASPMWPGEEVGVYV